MATLRNTIGKDTGIIVLWNSNPEKNRPSTYQVTDEAVVFLSDIGYKVPNPGDEEDIPWDICRPLRVLSDLYFKSESPGEAYTGDVSDIDSNYAEELNDRQRQQLREYILTHDNYKDSSEALAGELSSLPEREQTNNTDADDSLKEGDIITAPIVYVDTDGNGHLKMAGNDINIGPVIESSVGQTVKLEIITETFAVCLDEEVRGDNYATQFWRVEPDEFHKFGRPAITSVDFCSDCGSVALDLQEREETVMECGTCGARYVTFRYNRTKKSNSLEELRKEAEAAATENVPKSQQPTTPSSGDYTRSPAIRKYVLRRAEGACEGCEKPAPFKSKTGDFYLQTHHIHELSDGGPDSPVNVIALCPNCHYRVHHGMDGEDYNDELRKTVEKKESTEQSNTMDTIMPNFQELMQGNDRP